MKIAYPLPSHKPGFAPLITQPFGANPAYYAKFTDAHGVPEKGHMGIDFMASHGQPVYAVHDGFAFYVGPDAHGGDGVYLRFEDAQGNWWTCIYWHLIPITDPHMAPTVDKIGRDVKRGDVLGFADNSGAPWESTGDHLHFGLVPCDSKGNFLYPANGYGGCVNPMPYFDGTSAAPAPKLPIIHTVNNTTAVNNLLLDAEKSQATGSNRVASIYRAIASLIQAFTGT